VSPNFRRQLLIRTLTACDIIIVCVVFVAALTISYGTFTWPSFTDVLFVRVRVINLLLLGGYLAFCTLVFTSYGFYRAQNRPQQRWDAGAVFAAVNVITAVLLAASWPFELDFVTPLFLLAFWLLLFAALLATHEITHRLLHLLRAYGKHRHNVVIIGEQEDALALARRLRLETSLGYRVLRVINVRGTHDHGHHSSSLRDRNDFGS